MKKFNTTAICISSKHYMVDLSERVGEIKTMVDDGKYFTINRARQYGKTTTLKVLQSALQDDYIVLSLSFEGIAKAGYQSEGEFVQTFSRLLLDQSEFYGVDIPEKIIRVLESYSEQESEKLKMDVLFRTFRRWIVVSKKPVVLFIDEVDNAANNQVFLDFLGLLRDGYIARESDGIPAFWSVILAGVTDVKHLKSKIRDEEDAKENSPWNIAADFTVDMSLSENGIKGMLGDYEADHHTGMDVAVIAREIREYTNGYPFLVSRICQLIDERLVPEIFGSLEEAWTKWGIDEAVKLLLAENNTLFQSLTKNLNNYPELKASIRSILMEGTKIAYNAQQDDIVRMQMYGLIRNDRNTVRVSNRIFETMLYNLFLTEEELKSNVFSKAGDLAKNQFVVDGKLNMRLILQRFSETYVEIFGPLEEKFKEKTAKEWEEFFQNELKVGMQQVLTSEEWLHNDFALESGTVRKINDSEKGETIIPSTSMMQKKCFEKRRLNHIPVLRPGLDLTVSVLTGSVFADFNLSNQSYSIIINNCKTIFCPTCYIYLVVCVNNF